MKRPMAVKEERGPFAGLLLAQLFFIGLVPFVSDSGLGRAFLNVGIFTIMGAGAYASLNRRGSLIISIFFIVASAGAWLGPDFLPGNVDEMIRVGVTGLAFSFTAFVVLLAVSTHEEVTTETILGGINAYLLLAFAFMMFHAFVAVANPDAYEIRGQPLYAVLERELDSYGFATMLYYSFTTLTTLGYGDMVPTRAFSRLLSSGQAVLGQLYVAIFIARLVSLEVSQRANRS